MNGKYALITGASSGIGYEIASELAKRGYNLILCGRNREKLSEAGTSLKTNDNDVMTLSLDLASPSAPLEIYESVRDKRVEVLVNNAGFGVFGEFTESDINRVESMLSVNISALVKLTYLFARDMKKSGNGYILNVASTAAYQPVPSFAAYAATKSFVLSFSEAVAKELEDYGVTVTCLSPGATDTGFFNEAGLTSAEKSLFEKKYRMPASKVARKGVNALFAGKLSVIPGFMNKLLAFLNRFAPRTVVAAISKKLVHSPLKKNGK